MVNTRTLRKNDKNIENIMYYKIIMESIDDGYTYLAEVSKAIYIMCGVAIVFIVGMVIERQKTTLPLLPVETKNTV